MKKVFWQDPYQTQLKTSIESIDGNDLLLKETIIFSFSGGQESDKATINNLSVVNSKMDGSLIYYTLPEGHDLNVGDEVNIEIDWVRRYRLMRLHFAAELILELVTQKLSLEKIGAHIAENKARIDFVCDENISQYFDRILLAYNEIIENDLPIQTGYLDESIGRRYWKIDGFAQVPCGGTHVKSTREVGLVNLKRKNIGGGKERIEIALQTP